MFAVAVTAGATQAPASAQADDPPAEQLEPPGQEVLDSEVTLTLGVRGGAGEVAINSAGVACEATCTTVVPKDTQVTVVAHAPAGFVPLWGGACEGTTGESCTLTPDADAAVTVTFMRQATQPPPPPPATTSPPPATTSPPPPPTVDPGDPPPPTVAPGPTAGQRELDRVVAGLPIGKVVFNVPSTLELGETAVIHLALSLRETHAQLKKQIDEIGEIAEGELRVSDDMRATLTGADFEIAPLTEERQAVSAEETTEWRWHVKALETGVRTLQLTLYAFVGVGGKETTRQVETFSEDLTINVTWVARLSDFAGGNWQWLWTAILVPLAAFLMARRRGRRAPESGDARHA